MSHRSFVFLILLGAAGILVLQTWAMPRDRDVSKAELSSLRPKFEFRGRIVFQSSLGGVNGIYLLTSSGVRRLTNASLPAEFPRWSPDGSRIAFSGKQGDLRQIFVMNADGTDPVQVTRAENDAGELAWFPDGKKIAYTTETRRGKYRTYHLWSVEIATGRTERLVAEFPGSSALPDFSPVFRIMVFSGKKRLGWDIYAYDFDTRKISALTESGDCCRARFSPDGKRLAYVSSEADHRADIWTMNADGSGRERLTATDTIFEYFPCWSPDGRSIAFSEDKQGKSDRGRWAMYVLKVSSKAVVPFFDSGTRDVFPDWK